MDILTGLSAGNWIAILALIVAVVASIIVPFVLHNLSKKRDARQNVIDQGSLTMYINTSGRVKELCKRIAGGGNAHISESTLSALLYPFIINELYYLGLETISDIDNSLKEFEDTIIRFTKELYKEKVEISRGECIKILCDFLMAKNRSIKQIIQYYDKNAIHLPKERKPYAEKVKSAYEIIIKDL